MCDEQWAIVFLVVRQVAAILIAAEGRGGHFDPQCVDAILERWSDAVEVMHLYAD